MLLLLASDRPTVESLEEELHAKQSLVAVLQQDVTLLRRHVERQRLYIEVLEQALESLRWFVRNIDQQQRMFYSAAGPRKRF